MFKFLGPLFAFRYVAMEGVARFRQFVRRFVNFRGLDRDYVQVFVSLVNYVSRLLAIYGGNVTIGVYPTGRVMLFVQDVLQPYGLFTRRTIMRGILDETLLYSIRSGFYDRREYYRLNYDVKIHVRVVGLIAEYRGHDAYYGWGRHFVC